MYSVQLCIQHLSITTSYRDSWWKCFQNVCGFINGCGKSQAAPSKLNGKSSLHPANTLASIFLFWSFNLTRQFFLANYVSQSEFSSETLMIPPQRWIIMPLSSTKMIQIAIPGRKEIFSRGATKCPRSLIIDKLKRRSWTTSSAPRSTIPESGLRGSIRLVKSTLSQNNRKISCVFLDGPSLVYVNVFVRSFSSIDDVKMVRIVFSKLFLKIPR